VSTLGEHLDDYLRLRRGLGFQLVDAARFLAGFVAYLEARGATTVTVELAVAWARQPEGIKPISVDYRLSAARCFARYLHAIDPAHEVPPPGLLSVPRRRPAPYIYTPDQLAEVVATAQQLAPPLRAATCPGRHNAELGIIVLGGIHLTGLSQVRLSSMAEPLGGGRCSAGGLVCRVAWAASSSAAG
jgi:integrase/recombinase XerD